MARNDEEQHSRSKQADVEQELFERLTAGEMEERNKEEQATAILPPKYEVRIQADCEPVAEETKLYRTMARELDDRYDKYMKEDAPSPSSRQPGKSE
ncbi:hypothetical protein DUZ99_14675 [Xylanibacillus composti]|uniref:Uncharacterized protein n=1 Tax=Xylanibacillus composti TaxID=1572762 RepID=A0A8J4H3W8_9BACL|nr:hypothetical protein [Xylanibacillus composti]MDT9726223.1 hypothetical protein [Xylanibacillus composti]GIQ68073.1 hypothetical protein XYCOK13_08970 [Xylanibacillus composti]